MTNGGIPQSKEILTKARHLFPKDPLIAYNLACYACQIGEKEEARKWLRSAFDLGGAKQVKPMALKDPDLQAIWEEIREISI
jgi:hypothetical protein